MPISEEQGRAILLSLSLTDFLDVMRAQPGFQTQVAAIAMNPDVAGAIINQQQLRIQDLQAQLDALRGKVVPFRPRAS